MRGPLAKNFNPEVPSLGEAMQNDSISDRNSQHRLGYNFT